MSTEQEKVAAAVAYIKHHENWLGRMEAYGDVLTGAVVLLGALALGLFSFGSVALGYVALACSALSQATESFTYARIKQRRAEIIAYCEAKLGTNE